MLMGLGKAGPTSLAFLGMGVANLALSLALVKPFWIVGVAVGTAVPLVFFSAFVGFLACRAVEIPIGKYVGYVLGRPSLGALPALLVVVLMKGGFGGLSLGTSRGAQAVPLVASGLAMMTVLLLTNLVFVYRDDPHVALPGRVLRLLPSSWRAPRPPIEVPAKGE
jgi:hypothetical protein